MPKKLLLIANPKAGLKRIRRSIPSLKKLFESSGFEVEIYETKGKGDATKEVLEKSIGYDIIVCAGGDGTLNETVSGLMQLNIRPLLGYIPAGTTNDFAASMGIPLAISKAAKHILKSEPRYLDIGSINERFFSYSATFGIFTEASYLTPQNFKNSLGQMAYLLEGVKELSHIKPRRLRVETEHGIYEEDYIFGAVSNSTSLGGIIKLNTGIVDFSDGLFEIMLIKNPKNAIELSKIVLSLRTKKYDDELIRFIQSKSVKFFSEEFTPWSLDGEYFEGGSIISITNIHNAIKILSC